MTHIDSKRGSAHDALRIVGFAVITSMAGGCQALSAFEDAQLDTAKHDVDKIAEQVAKYREMKRGKCPADLADLKNAGIASSRSPDPWETDYRVTCDADRNTVEVTSAGPDKKFDTDDDIENAAGS